MAPALLFWLLSVNPINKESQMNEQTVKGKWNELKGEILNTWGKITGDELDKAKGNFGSVKGLIQQKYGSAKEEISAELHKLFDRYGQTVNEKAEDVKADLRASNAKPAKPDVIQ
jgi:uncharacterized protein YjbJ (UPF0337 family)